MARLAVGVVVLFVAALGALVYLGLREDDGAAAGPASAASSGSLQAEAAPGSASPIERGAYLARAGNCAGCHTVRGGAPFAGGRGVPTPFGTIYSTNLTPDPATGLGNWNADDFWRALHNGKSPGGRLLYPAFPYPDYTRITRPDADALFAYLRSLAPVTQAARPTELRFPYDQRWLLALWRGLYFRAGVFQPDPARDARWNRGAYLVQGLGHCGACHTPRTLLGATDAGKAFGGGVIPQLDWYAPPLSRDSVLPAAARPAGDAGEAARPAGHGDPHALVALLRDGLSDDGVIVGPMAEVVRNSLQYLSPADLQAISAYVTSLPSSSAAAAPARPASAAALERGRRIYDDHCRDCHQADGGGMPPAYPRLAGNPALSRGPAVNALRMILNGGFSPGTAGNPRPFGMPPFAALLDDQQIADVATYVRQAWGNQAPGVEVYEVNRYRSISPD